MPITLNVFIKGTRSLKIDAPSWLDIAAEQDVHDNQCRLVKVLTCWLPKDLIWFDLFIQHN